MFLLVVSKWPSESSEAWVLKRTSIALFMYCFPVKASVQGVDRYTMNLQGGDQLVSKVACLYGDNFKCSCSYVRCRKVNTNTAYVTYIPGGHTATLLLSWSARTAVVCCSCNAKMKETNEKQITYSSNTNINRGEITVLTFWGENNQNIWWSLFYGAADYAYSPGNFSRQVWVWSIRWHVQWRNFVWGTKYQLLAQNILTRSQSGAYITLLFLIKRMLIVGCYS